MLSNGIRFARRHGLVTLVVAMSFVLAASVQAEVGVTSADGAWMEVEEWEAAGTAETQPALDAELYRVFRLDPRVLSELLVGAPMERTSAGRASETELALPLPDGSYHRFRVVESPVFSPELAAEYPEVRSYAAQGIDDPTASARFIGTPAGFFAYIRTVDGMIYVEPYERGGEPYCICYRGSDVVDAEFVCHTPDDLSGLEHPRGTFDAPSGETIRDYNLAVSATVEFTTHFDPGGGQTNTVAEIAATVTGINAVYVPEVTIQLTLVCMSIYEGPDPTSDPFDDPDNPDGDLLQANHDNLVDQCGVDAFDIGHLFHEGPGGGLATRSSVCDDDRKGRGYSSATPPGVTQNIWVTRICHEMGHQFSATHTYNDDCYIDQREAATAFEIGGGSTIMSYGHTSACQPQIQAQRDRYFHGGSFDQITNYREGDGDCGDPSATGNTPPEVDAGPDYTIPQGTPFTLTAVGSDADGHAIAYCWEQFDADGTQSPTSPTGPLFRSRPATIDPSRTFPIMEDLLAGPPWPTEILPMVDRPLNFRCTVRDNQATGGGVNNDGMLITVSGDPFMVDYPNGGELLIAGCPIVIEWTVGGGVVADYVNILYSDDGGDTWTFLVTDTPNDGAELVDLPCQPTTEARILVEASDNIFFDVSDDDFELVFPEMTIVSDVDWTFDPPNPWVQDGLIIDHFEVTCDTDLFNLHFVADPLQDPSVPCEASHTKMISGDLVEFVPEVINYLPAGETVEVEIKIVIPVGQHAGDYEGLVHVLAEPECGCPMTLSEDFETAVEVEDETDVDFADDRGNVSRDLMVHLRGAKLDEVSGTITVVNPDSDENNPDMADGPGNVRINLVDTEIDDLVKIGDPAVTIPGSAITLLGDASSLASGEAVELEVIVTIPDGIPINAFYTGEVTFDYESCLGGQEVSDTFTIMLEVLQTQGTLEIVTTEVEEEFCTDLPWLLPGQVAFDFEILANGDHRNIRVSSGGLQHASIDTRLEDFAFFPEEIAFMAAGETRTVDVIVTIPVGQHSGTYSGYIQIVSENAGEDQVPVTIDICDLYDLDIRDNYGHLSGNVMEVSATARASQSGGEWALRAFEIGLPDGAANNYDGYDGPGNAPITCLTYEFDEWSYMWQGDDQGHNYHLNKRFTGEGSVIGELCDWSSGEFRRLLVAIFVPKMIGGDNHPGTYKGRLDCWANAGDADAEVVDHDFFDIEIHLSRVVGGEPIEGDSAFGGYPDDGGAKLYWGRFDEVGLTGAINLYREDDVIGSYTQINSTPLDPDSNFLDTEIEAGTEYNYRLGIGHQGSEFFIGPVTVGGAPKFHHLSQNAPNPFRNGTDISYQLPSFTHVSLRVYDVSGRLVRILKDGEEPAGFYTAVWDRKDERGRDVASGVYFYRYVTPLFEETRKMVVLH